MKVRICPETGAEMHRGTRSMTIHYKGHSKAFEMPGWYVDGVEGGIHDGRDLKVSDRALNELKAEVEMLPLPGEVRSIRKKLNLTQKDAGLIIGGGPRAFQKYESGDTLVSKAISTALFLLSKHPEDVEDLKKRRA